MSAPNQGRQSPEPGQQKDSQIRAPATDVNHQGQEPKEGAADASKDQLKNLGSNPGGPLDKAAEEKTSKTQ
ncbi:hypothetical protein CLAFUW4_11362 [Fulvia fulva]|uniref:Uncharacterized protein n=1 Tax=Passalora fulva TaxID=5499 RepID=A0A9Q8PD00_PASFU|nr:uncharacterized protein CLAFUR5_10403 [Fulvia fulva]KAK4620021.1 hypothetical protein CLAFUR4_11368 [Fulvia fulva]KAK4620849.1 hypothetical protein CLAFUR0_11374 [Fulvia fulva]UJO20165.1 hypothetical protein CLAFUR5_10403 [Fulvia fulva]WPV17350.1 hypothetical protein CLAFUW4_11362 [Fulvia fulva]WPV31807.1 hypothetical protein CLAFUW7_11358 [Fulvia fulva]